MHDFGGFADASALGGWDEKTSSHDVNGHSWTSSSGNTSVEAGGWNAYSTRQEPEQSSTRPAAARIESTAPAQAKRQSTETNGNRFARLQLLLSLDTALALIQVNRESLQRMEAFMVYPPSTSNGRRVKEEMEEVCLSLFQVLGEEHIAPGFTKATEEIKLWNPVSDSAAATSNKKANSSEEAGGSEVVPLVQFFELTHIADTIQQLCSVYFTQTLKPVVKLDTDDFLNPVVRAKKAFEGTLDEFVAAGLSVSVDLLMKRAEHLLFSLRDPLDYASPSIELGTSTRATRTTIDLLSYHSKLLVGATDREILDLFYTEIASRLFTILTKHLKSLTITTTGAFTLISDLNHLSTFIATLRIKDQHIANLYNSLKTLANYYIVDGRELIALLKNKTESEKSGDRDDGFVFGQEELYEFLKSRSDFRVIEKQVDHEIFGFKVSEDCVVC